MYVCMNVCVYIYICIYLLQVFRFCICQFLDFVILDSISNTKAIFIVSWLLLPYIVIMPSRTRFSKLDQESLSLHDS